MLDRIDQQLIQAENDGIDQSQIEKGYELILEIKELLSKNQIKNAKIVYVELKELMKNIGISVRIT